METNKEEKQGGISVALKDVDVCIALSTSGPGVIKKEWVSNMADNAIMFACANPVPEIWPWDAKEAGVKVVIGSDSTPIGEIGILEIEQFVLSGVSEIDALIAATRNPAEMCGVLDKLGTVEENKLADLVVLTDNPLENISNIRKVNMVFKDGVSVDLTHPRGTATYWDYYGKKNLKKGFLGDAENEAGFLRGLTEPIDNKK